jgi:hypothetical protein
MIYQFWVPFVLLVIAIIYWDIKYEILRDISKVDPKPYSWSRVQLAWWTVIILSAFIAILWRDGRAPTLHYSTIVLLSISVATTAAARAIDVSDITNHLTRHQSQKHVNNGSFLIDILSDQNGMSIHRLQAVGFNLVFGIWFICIVLQNLVDFPNAALICDIYSGMPDALKKCTANPIDFIMPAISDNNLVLLGVSSATYAAIKTTENKVTDPTPPPGDNSNAVSPAPTTTNTSVSTPGVNTPVEDDSNSGQHDR